MINSSHQLSEFQTHDIHKKSFHQFFCDSPIREKITFAYLITFMSKGKQNLYYKNKFVRYLLAAVLYIYIFHRLQKYDSSLQNYFLLLAIKFTTENKSKHSNLTTKRHNYSHINSQKT